MSSNSGKQGGERIIILEELNKHRVPTDAWLAFNDKVNDVKNLLNNQRGIVIYTMAGEN